MPPDAKLNPDPGFFYQNIFDKSLDGIIVISRQGIVYEANPAASRILGYSHEELIALDDAGIQAIFDPEHAGFIEKLLSEEQIQGDSFFATRDGKIIPVEYSSQIAEDHNNIIFLSLTFRDVSKQKAAENSLIQATQEYEDLYNNAPIGYHSLDENGVYLRVNDTELAWLGYTREEMVGKIKATDIYTPASVKIFKTAFPILKQQGFVKDLEIEYVRKDSKVLNVLLNTSAIYDETGRYIANRTIIYDITELKKVRQDLLVSEARYKFLTDNIIDVVIRMSKTGECLYVSPSSSRVMGYSADEMTGKIGFGYVHPEDLSIVFDLFDNVTKGNIPNTPLQFRFRHKDGYYIWLEISGHIIFSQDTGEFDEFVTISRDISQRKQYEESLELALKKEREFSELKSRFVSTASHEFRTPLATIMAATESLKIYRNRMEDHQIDNRFDKIIHQVGFMKSIIEDVLLLGRLQAGMVELKPEIGNLAELCQDIVDEFQTNQAYVGRIEFRNRAQSANFHFDKRIIRQILNNLVSNALKYSPEKGLVTLELAREADQLIIRVIDRGIGIPPEDQKHLFESFYRASNVESIPGTGLGLAISKQGIEMHGGRITVESVLGTGSTFTVFLPSG